VVFASHNTEGEKWNQINRSANKGREERLDRSFVGGIGGGRGQTVIEQNEPFWGCQELARLCWKKKGKVEREGGERVGVVAVARSCKWFDFGSKPRAPWGVRKCRTRGGLGLK